MTVHCFGCGVEKDPYVLEFFTQSNDSIVRDVPIDPLFVMCCEGWDEHAGDWRFVVVCHACFDRLDPDMWISSAGWKAIQPKVPFEKLPPHSDVGAKCGNNSPEHIIDLCSSVEGMA